MGICLLRWASDVKNHDRGTALTHECLPASESRLEIARDVFSRVRRAGVLMDGNLVGTSAIDRLPPKGPDAISKPLRPTSKGCPFATTIRVLSDERFAECDSAVRRGTALGTARQGQPASRAADACAPRYLKCCCAIASSISSAGGHDLPPVVIRTSAACNRMLGPALYSSRR